MQKNKGAGCLAITRSTIDILLSLAAQTSRGALIALAVAGVGIPTAVHAFHGRHAPRVVPQLAQAIKPQCYTDRAAGRMQARPLPCAVIEHLLDTSLSLSGDKFGDDHYASFIAAPAAQSGLPIARTDLSSSAPSRAPVKLTASLHQVHHTVG